MSIRTLLMPVISQHLLARERLLKLRARAERERLAGGLFVRLQNLEIGA